MNRFPIVVEFDSERGRAYVRGKDARDLIRSVGGTARWVPDRRAWRTDLASGRDVVCLCEADRRPVRVVEVAA